MKRDCSTCICKEGSCYPSITIFDKDKTCKSYSPDYEGYIADLEKENAELNEKVNILDNCDRLGDMITEAYKEQLTKAKEIIKTFLGFAEAFGYSPSMDKFISDTEQFISEVEK